ncbi:hypothetical protein DY000_02021777 [Brassica cretica]|uniref:F-box domain-containing protein n=1 Tax=Brassica cretica TaxID=69181 RepID=A0ABQ7EEK3_BRACR|nr:hypothetical protein DY000_02021777 [Brassica cretica]
MPEEIQGLVVERVTGHSFKDLYGLRASCKLMKALAERRTFFFTLNLQEEGLCLIKLAADAGYECVVYTHAMTRKIIWDDDEDYFTRFPRESVARIGKLV